MIDYLQLSRPVSRVLSRMIIYLEQQLPAISSDLPWDTAGHHLCPLLGLAPNGVCQAS